MRNILLLVLLTVPLALAAQPIRQGVKFVTSLPSTCVALGSATSDSPVSYQGDIYQCTSTNTWSRVANSVTFIPSAAGTTDLGSSSKWFQDLYFGHSGSFYAKALITPTANRTITFPDNTGTIAELNLAQTWTAGQTLSGATLSLANTATTATLGGTTTLDLSTGNIQTVTMPAGNTTITASNVPTGKVTIVIIQDSVGSRTITWNSLFKYGASSTLVLQPSVAANERTEYDFQCNGTNCYLTGYQIGTSGGSAAVPAVPVLNDGSGTGFYYSSGTFNVIGSAIAGSSSGFAIRGGSQNGGIALAQDKKFFWTVNGNPTAGNEIAIEHPTTTALAITTGTANNFLDLISRKFVVNNACAISSGSGSPEGAVTGAVCDIFLRTDGGTSTTLYVKQSGSGNTGWVAK